MGKLKALIAIAIVVGGIFVGWRMIPPYFDKYQLQDDLDDVARRASYTSQTDDDVKAIVIQKAQDENVPLKEDQIVVSRMPEGIGISIHYQVHVDLLVRPVDLDFTVNSLNKRI